MRRLLARGHGIRVLHLQRRFQGSIASLRARCLHRCRESPLREVRQAGTRPWTSLSLGARSELLWGPSALSFGQCGEVAFEVAAGLFNRVATEFLENRFREYEC